MAVLDCVRTDSQLATWWPSGWESDRVAIRQRCVKESESTSAWARRDSVDWRPMSDVRARKNPRFQSQENLESLTESQRHRQRARGRHRFNQIAVLGLNREFGKFVEYVTDVKKYAPTVLAIKIQMKIDQLIGPGHEVSGILWWHDAAAPRLIREIEAPDCSVL